MAEIRKFKNLRGILSYVFRCSTRSWEMYFLNERLGLMIGEDKHPLRPVYGDSDKPIKFKSSARTVNNLEVEPIVYDGSDIDLPPVLEEKVSQLDKKFEEVFKTQNENDYYLFLSRLAICVMNLYLPTDKELKKLEDETSSVTINQLERVYNSLDKATEEIEKLFKHRPIEAIVENSRGGNDEKLRALNFMFLIKRVWGESDAPKEFEKLKRQIEQLFKETSKTTGERNYGSMMIYYTIQHYYSSKKFKSTPLELEDFPYHYKEETRFKEPSPDIFCQFLAYQITSMFSGPKEESFSRFQNLKYREGYTAENVMTILTDDDYYFHDLYYTFERQMSETEGYSIEMPLLNLLEPYLEKYLTLIREGQPLSYDKLEQINKSAQKDTVLLEAIDRRRPKLPK